MTEHSRYGGSKAAQWLNCPGSVPLSDKAPPRTTSAYAEEGTFAHRVGELCLLAGQTEAGSYLGKSINVDGIDRTFVVDKETIDAVNVYLDAVWDAYDGDHVTTKGTLYVEEKFVLPIPSADEGEVFGSNDATVFDETTGKLTIFDYKHGKGVGVTAYENKQLMFYAAGAVSCHPEWDVMSIELVIVQPRGPFDDPISRWEMPMWMLIDYPDQIDKAVADSKTDAPTFASGDHCRWCPASTICTVREMRFIEAAKLDFAGIAEIKPGTVLPDAEEVTEADLAAILIAFDHLSAWVGTVRDRVDGIMLSGGKVPGFKVVDKVGRRKWSDDAAEIAGFIAMNYDVPADEIMPPKLVTITEAEKLIKVYVPKEDFKAAKDELTMKFMVKESSGYAVVHDSDRRAAVAPVAQEFGSVNVDSLFTDEG